MINYSEIVKEDRKREFAVHDELKGLSKEELIEKQAASTFPFAVCLLNVTGELNIGSTIRTACTMGAQEVVIFGRRWYDKRSAVNAWAYQKITRVEGLKEDGLTLDVKQFNKFAFDNGFIPVFCETGGTDLPKFDWDFYHSFCTKRNKTILLVFGAEGTGIPDEFMVNWPRVSIPMVGILRSMNVSHAAAMFMYDLKMKMGWW